MNNLYQKRFDRLEKEKQRIVDYLHLFPADQLKQTAGAQWSMVQAMRHIQMSEQASLDYMQKKMQAGDTIPKQTFKSAFLLQVMSLVFRLGIRFKAPDIIAMPKNGSLDDLLNDWESTRRQMEDYLKKYPNQMAAKAPYKHPYVGRLTVKNALRFFLSHQKHHYRQLKRISKSL